MEIRSQTRKMVRTGLLAKDLNLHLQEYLAVGSVNGPAGSKNYHLPLMLADINKNKTPSSNAGSVVPLSGPPTITPPSLFGMSVPLNGPPTIIPPSLFAGKSVPLSGPPTISPPSLPGNLVRLNGPPTIRPPSPALGSNVPLSGPPTMIPPSFPGSFDPLNGPPTINPPSFPGIFVPSSGPPLIAATASAATLNPCVNDIINNESETTNLYFLRRMPIVIGAFEAVLMVYLLTQAS